MNVSELQKLEHRAKLSLLVLSLAAVAVIATAALRENVYNDWRPLRSRYAQILNTKAADDLGRAAARQFEIRLVQNYLPKLNAVDRCVTCHPGLQDPRMTDQEVPFRTHPHRYLEIHDPDKFGCTVCHEGQGRATEIDEAHGVAPFWDYPMLENRFVVTSCTKCHEEATLLGPEGLIARAVGSEAGASAARLLEQGRELVTTLGCRACHTINGTGGVIGPDLSFVGSKTRHQFDFSQLRKDEPREVVHWLREHFRDPQRVSPGSKMPPVKQGDDAVEALTAYVLSLKRKAAGIYAYSTPAGGSH